MISIAADKQYGAALTALSDPTRRRIVALLAEGPRTATELHRQFPIAGPAVSRHLRVLREAGLVEERRTPEDGRVRLYELRPEPLGELARWLDGLTGSWQSQLESFKDHVALRTATTAKGDTR
ncbi:MAG TPA: metalloregulator ArsR/SmtB family transcription factor [Thermoleophilaceae bacterium]|nr:metalloregulator ArsR/SmtB family transcription factor [Thermoleophilaceae bacterium]